LPGPASLLHVMLNVPILHCMHMNGNHFLVEHLQGYLPAQLYNLNSCYGNKEQLQSLTWALNYAGIKPVADIVINHRCADVQNAEGIWNSYRYIFMHPAQFETGNAAQCQYVQYSLVLVLEAFILPFCRQMCAMPGSGPKALLYLIQKLKTCNTATCELSSS